MKRTIRDWFQLLGGLVLPLLLLLTACDRGAPSTEELEEIAAALLPRLEVLSGLEAREPIRLAWQSRAEMQEFVERQLDEELPPEYLDEMKGVYTAFGLLPDTLDLRALLLELYSEQVVGYYDPAAETLYIVEGTPTSDIETVLVHELVHALQDQHANLDSLIARERGNDAQTAAQAALEGQATLVMFALLIERQLGREIDPAQIPPIGDQMQSLLDAQNSQFPVFQNAPRLIRETLLFPYIGGASFVQTLWEYEGRRDPDDPGPHFTAPLGEFMPQSTEQVLYPLERFLEYRDPPIGIEIEGGPTGAKTLLENDLGAFEIGILLDEHLGADTRTRVRGWAGDRYRYIELEDGRTALIWYTLWDDDVSADSFADAYRQILERRPERRGKITRTEIEGEPAVIIIDTEASLDPEMIEAPPVRRLVRE